MRDFEMAGHPILVVRQQLIIICQLEIGSTYSVVHRVRRQCAILFCYASVSGRLSGVIVNSWEGPLR